MPALLVMFMTLLLTASSRPANNTSYIDTAVNTAALSSKKKKKHRPKDSVIDNRFAAKVCVGWQDTGIIDSVTVFIYLLTS